MTPDRPWIFRTYAGFGTPRRSNERFRANLSKGQTGLSVAFDLPTQCGYDSYHAMSKGEVGRVGVPIGHLGDMRAVFDGIPMAEMNTSMTINATAVWLLALYVAVADDQGADRAALTGTTQNDILKEYLSRGTYAFPPEPSMRLCTDLITWTLHQVPRWNPINVCSYHLQEAGAGPVLEAAFTMANAVAVLDHVRASGRVWDGSTGERYGVADPKRRRFRYGVQVNSLGLTAEQPENNVYRILLEMVSVTMSKDARARAVQLPAWNEALGLPRAWDQQWSLRAQQILAHETDLLEHDDLFAGSKVIEAKTDEIAVGAWDELERVLQKGGSVEALAYMKEKLVAEHALKRRAIETGDKEIVGVNAFTTSEPSPLAAGVDSFEKIEPEHEAEQVENLQRWRAERDDKAVASALDGLRRAASSDDNLVEPSVAAARAGGTTGEWADALREVFGEYRAPTGVGAAAGGRARELEDVRTRVAAAAQRKGVAKLRLLVAKPGLDGHSNAAEQVAVRARDAGLEVIYQGIRLTPQQIARAAADEDVHMIAVSVLSGAHNLLIPDVIDRLRAEGIDPSAVPLVVGGVIPDEDAAKLQDLGVARV